MSLLIQVLLFVLDIVMYLVLAHVVMSWLISFNVLNIRQPIVAQIWHALERILDPLYSRIRQVIPNVGMLDLSPLILLVGIYVVRIVIYNYISPY